MYQTRFAETAWVHWPGIGNESAVDIPFDQSLLVHATPVTLSKKPQTYNFHRIQLPDLMSQNHIQNLSESFHSSLPKTLKLETFSIYNTLIFQCYFNYYDTNDQKCLTPLLCPMPKRIEGFQCEVAKKEYTKTSVTENLVAFVSDVTVTWSSFNEGCEILTNRI